MTSIPPPFSGEPLGARPPITSTQELLAAAKSGDETARGALLARYIPRLQKWASGRLPRFARSLLDTEDLVQDALLRTLEGLDRVEVRGPGGFQAYVRQAILNRIRDQVRWSARRPGPGEVPEDLTDATPSPLEEAIGADLVDRFEKAMAGLSAEDQELLHLRIELDFSAEEIAGITGRPSRDAARMAVQRALARLAEAMGRGKK